MNARTESSKRPAGQPRPTSAPAPPTWADRRLILCAILFVGWLGYLAYLVFTLPQTPAGRPLVLSRPQFLVSELDVVAEVKGEGDAVTVKEVLYPAKGAPVEAGDTITVTNLRASQEELPPDLAGPGAYLLPLRRVGDHYEVVSVPASPGYPPPGTRAVPRIYPATEEALAQYRAIPKP